MATRYQLRDESGGAPVAVPHPPCMEPLPMWPLATSCVTKREAHRLLCRIPLHGTSPYVATRYQLRDESGGAPVAVPHPPCMEPLPRCPLATSCVRKREAHRLLCRIPLHGTSTTVATRYQLRNEARGAPVAVPHPPAWNLYLCGHSLPAA